MSIGIRSNGPKSSNPYRGKYLGQLKATGSRIAMDEGQIDKEAPLFLQEFLSDKSDTNLLTSIAALTACDDFLGNIYAGKQQ